MICWLLKQHCLKTSYKFVEIISTPEGVLIVIISDDGFGYIDS